MMNSGVLNAFWPCSLRFYDPSSRYLITGISTNEVQWLSDYGRLGRKAAEHPRSALRVVKAAGRLPNGRTVLLKPKQQLCIHKVPELTI
jgi:hypothetical protein